VETFTEAEIRRLANDWYQKLDRHAPIDEILPLLAEDGFEIRVPEGTFRGSDGFKRLYEDGWIRNFFDEVHTLEKLSFIPAGDKAEVKVVVHWQARAWHPPAPQSERIDSDAYQTWIVQRSPASDQLVILAYLVDDMKPRSGPDTI
jgi:hypothetical protein